MLFGDNYTRKTHYDILGVKEGASFEEIRTSYRSAILNSHPDKLQKTTKTSNPNHDPEDRFREVQRAWEILSDSRSRIVYDSELRALRHDSVVAEDISLMDLMVEDAAEEEALVLSYQCRCGDYFSIDSVELGEIGYSVLRDGDNKISLQASSSDALRASVLLPCGSCSLKVRIFIDTDIRISTQDHL